MVTGIVMVRFVSRAAEPGPAIRVDSKPVDRSPQAGNSYSPVVKRVAPSVVRITIGTREQMRQAAVALNESLARLKRLAVEDAP